MKDSVHAECNSDQVDAIWYIKDEISYNPGFAGFERFMHRVCTLS